jgi:hypothetical protein
LIDSRDERPEARPPAARAAFVDDDEYEYQPLRIDPSMSRGAAATMLAVRAEFSGWELARTLKFTDGSRKVWLRRRRSRHMLPGLIV